MDKIAALKIALESRKSEIQEYQINIDNFELAIQEIEFMSQSEQDEMAEFKANLEKLLKEHIHEQKKAAIMLRVVQKQLGGEYAVG